MTRAADRLLGKTGEQPPALATRPYGMSPADAQALAAAAVAVPIAPGPKNTDGTPVAGTQNSGTVAATTGDPGSRPNLTTGGALP